MKCEGCGGRYTSYDCSIFVGGATLVEHVDFVGTRLIKLVEPGKVFGDSIDQTSNSRISWNYLN